MAAINFVHNRARRKQKKQITNVWVLELVTASSPIYYLGNVSKQGDALVTAGLDKAKWYQSKHEANEYLTNDMKHDGFVAREHQLLK